MHSMEALREIVLWAVNHGTIKYFHRDDAVSWSRFSTFIAIIHHWLYNILFIAQKHIVVFGPLFDHTTDHILLKHIQLCHFLTLQGVWYYGSDISMFFILLFVWSTRYYGNRYLVASFYVLCRSSSAGKEVQIELQKKSTFT